MRLHLAGLLLAGLTGTGLVAAPIAASAAETSAKAATDARRQSGTAPEGQGTATDLLAPLLGTLQIGTPMPQLPDCADKRTPDGTDVTAFCVELRGDGMMRQVGVPRAQRPAFMDGAHALALVDRNALVGVIVPTDGMRSEQVAMQSLIARYGKPFRQETVPMLDKGGKKVETQHAGWMKAPLTVELYAMPDDPQTGSIELLLPRARTLMAARDAEVDQQLNPQAGASDAKGKPAPKAPAAKPKDAKPGTW